MKKSNLPSLAWAFLVALSFASYTYLNCSAQDLPSYSMQEEIENGFEEEDASVFLLDIVLVKKLLNVTKIVLPKD